MLVEAADDEVLDFTDHVEVEGVPSADIEAVLVLWLAEEVDAFWLNVGFDEPCAHELDDLTEIEVDGAWPRELEDVKWPDDVETL